MPTDERWRFDIHQRIAPREHATQGCHHPTGGIVGLSWFDLALLEECQLLTKERFSAASARREWTARTARRIRSITTGTIVRKQCATVRKSDEPAFNAQHGTLQNVTGPTTAAWQEFLRTTGAAAAVGCRPLSMARSSAICESIRAF